MVAIYKDKGVALVEDPLWVDCDKNRFSGLLYHITGKLIKTLVNSQKQKGNYSVIWNRKDSAGNAVRTDVYFTVFNCSRIKKTRKLVIISP